jgi:hypothetical protein
MGSMERFKRLPFVLLIAVFACLCAAAQAQTGQVDSTHTQQGKPVPNVVRPMPFPIDSPAPRTALAVEFRAAEKMTEKDRLLEADAESAIGEKAGFADLEFNVGKWNYQQIVCPALPNHLFLGFTRNNGVGDVSLFTASIPRNGEGRVRIIPIQRRGYSFFSPAPINALTISAFNHIRTEEHLDQAPDWAGTALCYAALAGAHPEAEVPADSAAGRKYPQDPRAMMQIPERGGAIIHFTDVTVHPRPMTWTLTFNGKGKLMKATHVPEPLIAAKTVPAIPVDGQGRPIEAGAKVVPPAQW